MHKGDGERNKLMMVQ